MRIVVLVQHGQESFHPPAKGSAEITVGNAVAFRVARNGLPRCSNQFVSQSHRTGAQHQKI